MNLTEAELREVIAGGETATVEFKSERSRRLSDGDLVLAAVCLANGRGGDLLLGVEDHGEVTGARPRHGHATDAARLLSLVANNTQPPLQVDVQELEIDGKPVLVIRVPDSPRVVGTSDGRYVRRATDGQGRPGCVPFHAHEMLAHEIDRGVTDYASIEIPHTSWDDLDPLEFERLRKLVRVAGAGADQALARLSDEDIARALTVVTPGDDLRVRAGALLLFGREEALREHVPTHEVAFQVVRGTDVEVNEFARWPLFKAAEEIEGRFSARNTKQEFQTGLFRIEIPIFSPAAFREALANALVHRDFTRLGAVHVQLLDDRLEISDPGGFPIGVRLDNLLVTAPRPRSPILADAFKRAGLVERTGRGINRIFDEQLKIGRQPPDYSRSSSDDVVLVLQGGAANMAMAKYVVAEARAGRDLSLSDLLVVNELLRERRVSTADAARLLQTDDATTRALLNQMVDRGILQPRGEARARTYHLSASAYRALGEDVAYVRAHGFEPLQQEQMVLSYLDAHGRITRGQAAELCGLAPRQARSLLKRLVEEGKLRLRGSRRTAYYERAF